MGKKHASQYANFGSLRISSMGLEVFFCDEGISTS